MFGALSRFPFCACLLYTSQVASPLRFYRYPFVLHALRTNAKTNLPALPLLPKAPGVLFSGLSNMELHTLPGEGDIDVYKRQVRYSSLKRNFPKAASELYAAAEKAAKERYENYKRLAAIEY